MSGKMSEHLKLIKCSDLFKKQYNAESFFTQFIWSFEKSKMHKISSNANQINYFDYCNLSSNRDKALELALKYLWEITVDLCYEKWIKNDKMLISFIDVKIDEQIKKYEEEQIFKGNKQIHGYKVSILLQKILFNDWSFFFSEDIKDFENEFDAIFQTKPEDKSINILKFLSLLKPERLDLQMINQKFEDYINIDKINDMFKLGKSTQIQIFKDDNNKSQIHLMLSLSNNSTVHILNCLNTNQEEWNQSLKKQQVEDEKIQDIYLKKCKETNMIFENKQERVSNSKCKNVAYILQSLYLWKNISNIDWDDIFENSQQFLKQPFKLKEIKQQTEFIFSLVDYLQILPSVFLEKSEYDLEQLITVNQVVQKLRMKSNHLETNLSIDKFKLENNSIYLIYQSYDKIESYIKNHNKDFIKIFGGDHQDFDEQSDLYYLTEQLNGRILKEIQKIDPLIDFISNLYFIGLDSIHNKQPFLIVDYLEKSIKDDNSFMNSIFLEKQQQYTTIFNKIIIIMFSLQFSNIYQNQLDQKVKNQILNQIDDLLKHMCQGLRNVDDSVFTLIYAIFYLITGQKTQFMQEMKIDYDKKDDYYLILLKTAFENPDLSEFFFGTVKSGEGIAQNIDKMVNKLAQQLQKILDKPSQSINDPDLVKEVLKLIKYSSQGTVDITIIDDIISILTGDHQRLFNILRTFEIIDENKILLIQRTYNQVANMSIFQNKDKNIAAGPSGEQSDKMKEIVKKMQDRKATIEDVFYAVDNEGDNDGSISINEFQQFVRRLGMELSRHRVHEIFAYIKNTKIKPHKFQKSDQITLNEDEFDKSFQYVNNKITTMSLEMLSVSPALLALELGTLIIILILLFVFIFLGIKAFTVGGTFGAIINSIIPMAAAIGAAGSQEDKKENIDKEKVESAIEETQSIIYTNHL